MSNVSEGMMAVVVYGESKGVVCEVLSRNHDYFFPNELCWNVKLLCPIKGYYIRDNSSIYIEAGEETLCLDKDLRPLDDPDEKKENIEDRKLVEVEA